MIIRISGDGQYQIDGSILDQLNAVDEDLEDAMQAGDQERFSRELSRLLTLVRDAGERVDIDHLGPSELIFPPEDISLAELARFSGSYERTFHDAL
jgi:hypothetical protein